MNFFKSLLEAQAPTNFFHSDEYAFYTHYSYKLSDHEPFAYLSKMSDSFGIIRANIVLRSILNKEEIEKMVAAHSRSLEKGETEMPMEDFLANVTSELPYIMWQKEKIYVPIFPASLAAIYTNSKEKLFSSPYKKLFSQYDAAIVDPFDYYGTALFDSYFTKLVIIERRDNIMAAYDYDAECIYFINEQGRLDASIALFDKDLEKKNKNHMIPRIQKVVDAYFSDNKETLIKTLVEQKLISETLVNKIEEKAK